MQKQKKNALTETPLTPIPLVRTDYIAAALTFVAALAIYLLTLPPTVTGEDSGELIAAAYTLGIAHPPGYPLWCMLGHLFTWLPLGTVAWRVALMSAVLGAVTAAVVCLIVIKLTRNRWAGIAAGLALAFSAEFWSQSVIAEVYTLNAVLIALCVFILIVWEETREQRLLYVFAAVYGLGLCNHHTIHFLGPLFALFIMLVHGRPWRHWKSYGLMLLIAFGVWGVIHLYLPIRSRSNPAMDWGNPETLPGFLNVVLRGQYGPSAETMPHSLTRLIEQTAIFFRVYCAQFTLWLAWLPLLGLYPLRKRGWKHFALIAGLFIYVAAGIIWVTNYDGDAQSIWVNSVFFIPCFMAASIFIGLALSWLAQRRFYALSLLPAAAALGITALVVPCAVHYSANDKSDYYFARDYAMALFASLDKDAYYFAAGDHTLFPLLYLQIVENVRPDVTIAARYGYIEPELYADMPLELQQGFTSTKQHRLAVESWLIRNRTNPMYFAINRPMPPVNGKKFITAGLVAKVVDSAALSMDENCLDRYRWHSLLKEDTGGDYSALNFLHDYYFANGMRYFERGETQEAMAAMVTAADLAWGRKDLLHNVANTMAQHQLLEEAKQYYLMVLDFAPHYRPSLRDLANALALLEDFPASRQYYERLVALDETTVGPNHPRVASSSVDLGMVMVRLKDLDAARGCFERAYSIDQRVLGPEHPNTGRDLFNLALTLSYMGQESQAQEYGNRALEILSNSVPPNHPYAQNAQNHNFIPSFNY